MIRNSFVFLDRIKQKREQELWARGIRDWDAFLNSQRVQGIAPSRKLYYDRRLQHAKKALHEMDAAYFANVMPSTEVWRLYEYFKEETVFLDIETTGVTGWDSITVIGLFDGISTKTMIRGINLDLEALKRELRRYKMMITFNGATFDLPFLKKRYPDLLPDILHWDLRSSCEKIGLKGGLKQIEQEMGIKRNKIIEKMYGGDAVTLWRMFRATGDDYYLRLLVEYNEEDVINLKYLANYAFQKLKEVNGF
ncbi:ribonuclease H-like domain-containing protein [Candidatus Woesearchaeota archaeon]|nr:ribonuclease H-like domain-containing protein [Candidatus Woesearchaeota archaeon]